MCLITKREEIKIAKEDIKVIKLLKPDLIAVYQPHFQYKRDVKYETSFTYDSIGQDWTPFSGDYRNLLDKNYPMWDVRGSAMRDEMVCVEEGFHSMTSKKGAEDICAFGVAYEENAELFDAIIPKGSEYIEDGFGQIVSTALIIL